MNIVNASPWGSVLYFFHFTSIGQEKEGNRGLHYRSNMIVADIILNVLYVSRNTRNFVTGLTQLVSNVSIYTVTTDAMTDGAVFVRRVNK